MRDCRPGGDRGDQTTEGPLLPVPGHQGLGGLTAGLFRRLLSPTTARGIWALEDVVRFGPGVNLRGYGHYTETYEKAGDRWLITSSKLTRLREDVFNGFVTVYISPRIRTALMAVARRTVT